MEFFRHCPGCGRRFHIKLESKKLVTEHTETIPTYVHTTAVVRATGKGMPPAITPVTVHEGNPIIIDVEEFRYVFRCGHCGHEWSETRTDERKVS